MFVNSLKYFLLDNYYSVFLSATEDILRRESDVPKSSILLAAILPALFIKVVAPYFMNFFSYKYDNLMNISKMNVDLE